MKDIAARGRDPRLYCAVTLLFVIALAWAIMPEGFSFGLGAHAAVGAKQGSLIRRLQWAPLFIWAACLVWRRRDVALAFLLRINPFLPAFFAWTAASMLWSPYPEITLRKVVLFAGVGLIALAFQVAAWDRDRLLRLLLAVISTMLLMSAVMALAWPHLGRNGAPEYAWVGATPSKNHLGQLAGVGLLLWLQALAVRRVPRALALSALTLALALLLLSRSASSVVCVVVLAPLVWFMLRPPLAITRQGLLAAALLFFGGVVSLVFIYLMVWGVPGWHDLLAPVTQAVGRDVTLTGRLEIWRRVLVEVGHHLWLGQGFGAFWLGAGGPAPWVTQNLYGILWQAHNGYLDVLNETGVIGLILVLGFLGWHGVQTLGLAIHDRRSAALQVTIMGFVIINNLTESSLFRPINFLFFLSVVASISLTRIHVDIALRRRQARHAGIDAASASRAG